jgi:hypothetical protein
MSVTETAISRRLVGRFVNSGFRLAINILSSEFGERILEGMRCEGPTVGRNRELVTCLVVFASVSDRRIRVDHVVDVHETGIGAG